jgi:murein DD-endopeptidase MepM/ murein hydrolase activator NlpD
MIIYFHRALFTVFITVLFSLNAHAFEVELVPDEVIPGDVFLLKVMGEKPSAEVEFSDSTIGFYPASDNLFMALVPVDINTPPKKYTVKIRQGNKEKTVSVHVRPHEFKTIKLTLPEGKVTLSPENQKRATNEAVLLKKIWPQNTPKKWKEQFTSPTGTEVSTVFGVKRIMNEKKTSVHRGMDFRGKKGALVRSINRGKVVLTDDLFYGGNTLIVDHGMGLYSIYMHLSKFNAKKGEQVKAEQVIGFVGSTGRATGPHLHMSVKLNGVSVNPESLFELEL